MKKIICFIIIMMPYSVYAGPFNWNDNPVITDTVAGGARIYPVSTGLGVAWDADPSADFGYRIRIYNVNSKQYQLYERPTYETSLEIAGLTPRFIYDFQVFRIQTANDADDVLIARGVGYYDAGNSKAFWCYSGEWDVGLALTNRNSVPVDVVLHIGQTKGVVRVPAQGEVSGFISNELFAGKEMSGSYIVYIEPIPGVFLLRIQFDERGKAVYAETSE